MAAVKRLQYATRALVRMTWLLRQLRPAQPRYVAAEAAAEPSMLTTNMAAP